MSDELRPTFLARLARRPFPIFLGCALGFVACCIAGRVAARQQPFQNFVRFHPGIAPDSHYYPTFSQTLNLARQQIKHTEPGKTLVVVGGNSVMHGVGQRATHVWTRHLQKLLGDDYVVLNLAMRGQFPNEFGGLIAERLAADGVPVIYVTLGVENVGWGCDWDGAIYREFFWEAWGKGYLSPDPRRDAWLDGGWEENFRTRPRLKAQIAEQRRRGMVDGVTYSKDLWNYIAARYRGTVWTPLKAKKFWQPHRELTDDEAGDLVSFEDRNPQSKYEHELKNLRGIYESDAAQELLAGRGYEEVGETFKKHLPDVLRDRTLYLLRMDCTHYRDGLKPDERAKYDETYHRYRDAVRRSGLDVILIGEKYVARDYADRSHFSEVGGRKMAEDVAPTVRAMNARLYGPKGAEGAKP